MTTDARLTEPARWPSEYIFRRGNRVRIMPHTDDFMRGLRFGEVIAVGRRTITVLTDQGLRRRYAPTSGAIEHHYS